MAVQVERTSKEAEFMFKVSVWGEVAAGRNNSVKTCTTTAHTQHTVGPLTMHLCCCTASGVSLYGLD